LSADEGGRSLAWMERGARRLARQLVRALRGGPVHAAGEARRDEIEGSAAQRMGPERLARLATLPWAPDVNTGVYANICLISLHAETT
jgi:hypothetical protein